VLSTRSPRHDRFPARGWLFLVLAAGLISSQISCCYLRCECDCDKTPKPANGAAAGDAVLEDHPAGDAAKATPSVRAPLPAGLLDPKESENYFPLRGSCLHLGKDYILTGQLAQPDLDLAKENGVKSVILVRMQRELGGLGFEVEPHVQGLGLSYTHIPIGPELMTDELANSFVEAVAKAEKPLLIVGSNGFRVWGLWALYLGSQWGVPVDDVKAVATKVGIKRLVIDDFVRTHLAAKAE
jgi:uncharacterized protein (TIGR01244 family)